MLIRPSVGRRRRLLLVPESLEARTLLSVSSPTVVEGDSGTREAVFTVTYEGTILPRLDSVDVNYTTADGTAAAGSDYQPTEGTLTFTRFNKTQEVRVPVMGDTFVEPDETFRLVAEFPDGTQTGTATIANDDRRPPVVVTLSGGGSEVQEGTPPDPAKPFFFTIRLSRPLAPEEPPLTVSYTTRDGTAKAESDYRAVSASYTFQPGGGMLVSIGPVVLPDSNPEGIEFFYFDLTGLSGGPAGSTIGTIGTSETMVYIRDDDPVPPDRFEPNDTFQTQWPLGLLLGPTQFTNLTMGENNDLYAFRTAGPGRIDVTVNYDTRDGDLLMGLYDAADTVRSITAANGSKGTMHMGGEFGGTDYVLLVAGSGNVQNRNYTLSISPPVLPPDAYEPDNGFAAANELGVVTTRRVEAHNLHVPADEDYFKFTTAGAGPMTLSTGSDYPGLSLALYDASESLLASSDASSPASGPQSVTWTAAPFATYYARVASRGGTNTVNPGYALEIHAPGVGPDRFEPDDTFGTAAELGTLSGERREGQLTIHATSDADYFRFSPATGGDMTFALSDSAGGGALGLRLYDAQQGFLAAAPAAPAGQEKRFTFPVTAGATYFVQAYPATGTAGFTPSPGYTLTLTPPPRPALAVAGRSVFYNTSAYDGKDPDASPNDVFAVATDKRALLPGQGAATFANVTSYTRGINGVIVDFNGSPPSVLTADDFEFGLGPSADTSDWSAAPVPEVTRVSDPGAATASYDITWPDGAVRNTWLRVKVKAGARTGLAAPDVFYFGNLPGETGDSPSQLRVNALDLSAVKRALNTNSTITGPFDFNRDGRVNSLDVAAVRGNINRALAPAAAPVPPPPPAPPAPPALKTDRPFDLSSPQGV